MSIELKIKNKHLSEEARIIRFEENKELKKARFKVKPLITTGSSSGGVSREYYSQQRMYRSLKNHRCGVLRNENRATYLARAYLKGVSYSTVETKRKQEKEHNFQNNALPLVLAMIAKYGNDISYRDRFWQKKSLCLD